MARTLLPYLPEPERGGGSNTSGSLLGIAQSRGLPTPSVLRAAPRRRPLKPPVGEHRHRRGGGHSKHDVPDHRRFRPPRGTTYISAMSATMTTAAIATIATVDAARITAPFFPMNGRAKLTAHQGSSARSKPPRSA